MAYGCLRALLFLALSGQAFAVQIVAKNNVVQRTNPVGRVVNLLKDVLKKREEEGKREANTYDKIACFCKDQADKYQYNIEKNNETLEDLNNKLDVKNGDMKETKKTIEDLEAEILKEQTGLKETSTKLRDHLNAAQIEKQGTVLAIEAIEAAVTALHDSKKDMVKKAALVQDAAIKIKKTRMAPSVELALLQKPGDAAAFKYSSGAIIANLETLRDTFVKTMAEDDAAAARETAKFKSTISEHNTAIKINKSDLKDMKEQRERLADDIDTLEADIEQNEKDMRADDASLTELATNCHSEKALFTSNYESRQEELTALSKAIRTLEEGGVEGSHDSHSNAAVFMQISSRSRPYARIVSQLQTAGKRIKSSTLSILAAKVTLSASSGSDDPFVKVRGLIQDMIDKLIEEAKAEKEDLDYCKKNVKEAVDKRNDAITDNENENTNLAVATQNMEAATEKVAESSSTLARAENDKEKVLALFEEQEKENDFNEADATASLKAVKQAIEVLEGFYGLLQEPNQPEDATGKTLDENKYEQGVDNLKEFKKAGEGRGIIDMLEVIQSDFEAMLANTKNTRSAQTEEKDEQVVMLDAEIKEATEVKKTNKKKKVDAEDASNTATTNLKSAVKRLGNSEESLTALKTRCVDSEDDYEERRKRRRQEIEALKDARQILINWKG